MMRLMIIPGIQDWKLPGLASALLACLLLPSCQHSKETTSSRSSQPRGMESRLLKPNMTKGNPFEKQFNTASAGDRGAMKSFGSKSYRAKDVGGLKSFGGVKNFKTGEFSQAGKLSHMGKETSRFSSQNSRMGKQAFATKESRFGGMTARQDGQSFRGGNSTFKTNDFQPGKKALDDNKRIYVEPGQLDPAQNASAYSEDEVKRLLGR